MRISTSWCVLCISALMAGQTSSPTHPKSAADIAAQRIGSEKTGVASNPLSSGIVVDAVNKNSEGEKAGLQPGDILLDWTRGNAQGTIESPFELSEIEVEQAPRGDVT